MLTCRNLYKTYTTTSTGTVAALNGIDFEVRAGEIYTLLGPSGCGKSSTLRCVAGLETANTGVIAIGDTVVFDGNAGINVPPERRGIGMVFQSYGIWPHLTVYQNVAYPLVHGRRKYARAEIERKTMEALAMVQLEHTADRPAPMLSGGQQQRVALARALVYEPKLLLLDEPLSNLDAKLRVEMRSEIHRIIKQLGLTGLYVTHDQEEAMAISDRIAVMQDGVILQEATPDEIYASPANLFVAGFIGKSSQLRGIVTDVAADYVRIDVPAGGTVLRLTCRTHAAPAGVAAGDHLDVMIRPEDVLVDARDLVDAGDNVFEATLDVATFAGGRSTLEFSVDALRITAELPGRRPLGPGARVTVGVPIDRIHVFAASSG